jgi:ribokinase
MNNNPRILSVGSGLLDAFLTVEDANTHFRVEDKEFCIRFGDKIQLSSTEFQLGGNACNVSVGLSRLGLSSSLMAEIGVDEFSESILAILRKENVDTTFVVRGNVPSSFAIGLNFNNERTLFVQHRLREHAFRTPDVKFDFVYLTSMGREWREAYKTIAMYVKEHGIPLFFNPGTPQISEGKDGILGQLEATYVLFVNKTEASSLTGLSEDSDIKEMLRALSALGPKIVSVTDGRAGSYALDTDGKIYHVGIYNTPVVERTGAGDAFATGFTGARIFGKEVSECMQWGTMNASSVVEKVGAEAGLLTLEQLEARHAALGSLEVKELR